MRRISAVFMGKSNLAIAAPVTPPTREGRAPIPPPNDSWVVDETFLEESSRLVPASPDDVDDVTRALFVSKVFKGEDWEDADVVEYGLGLALDVFPEKSSFDSMKWVFWTDNALHRKLSNLIQALARPESRCLECRTSPDFQFRRFAPPI